MDLSPWIAHGKTHEIDADGNVSLKNSVAMLYIAHIML